MSSIYPKYTVYKITNLKNLKIYEKTGEIKPIWYIGQHIQEKERDLYFCSSEILNWAYKKHGRSIFLRIILYEFDTFNKMNRKEKELVNQDIANNLLWYNQKEGGLNGQQNERN